MEAARASPLWPNPRAPRPEAARPAPVSLMKHRRFRVIAHTPMHLSGTLHRPREAAIEPRRRHRFIERLRPQSKTQRRTLLTRRQIDAAVAQLLLEHRNARAGMAV